MALLEALLAAVRAETSDTTVAWFERARDEATHGSLTQLLRVYTDASRRLGDNRLSSQSIAIAGTAGVALPLHWTAEDAGRLAFLLSRYQASPHARTENMAAAIACYEQGDSREQLSWLRTAGFLPAPEDLLPVVIDACRTSIVPLFEAVCCENPYPASHFPDRNFNQMVLKALFNGIAVERIVGLTSRLNPELSRMASDYADERRAAGRPIPADIAAVLGPNAHAQRIH